MNKKLAIIIAILILLCTTVVYAHSGRTDSKGGHYNRSTGVYHYHNGGGSSSSGSRSQNTPLPPVVYPTQTPYYSMRSQSASTAVSTPIPTPNTNNLLSDDGILAFSKGEDVRVRKEANTSSSTVAYLSKGQAVELLANDGKWCKVATKSFTGYVRCDWLTLEFTY